MNQPGRSIALFLASSFCLVLAYGGCSTQPAANNDDTMPENLATLGLFEGDPAKLIPAKNVRPYEINTTSFYDHAQSSFVMKLPAGGLIEYKPDGPFEYPVGTVLAQTLSYADAEKANGRRLVETRVMIRLPDRWIAIPYIWNEQQTEARLEILGERIAIQRRLSDGTIREQTHLVPNFNDCKRCHKLDDVVTPLAAGVRQLNCPPSEQHSGKEQLAVWRHDGLLKGLPTGDAGEVDKKLPRLARASDPESGTVERRARAWLESNCAHCHNPRGTARNSGLQLAAEISDPQVYGVLKTPVAAGRGSGGLMFDILPGKPKLSIMLYRVRSTEPGIIMPEFGRMQVDEEGAALLSEWIESMASAESLASQAGLVGIVAELKPEELSSWGQAVVAEGNARRGEAVFQRQDLNCVKCHAVAGKGANVGPDLTKIGPQAKVEQIVESILMPNKVIKEGFRAVTIQTEAGQVLTGVKVYEDEREVVLRDPVRGETRLTKAEIAERSEGESLMPAQLVAALKREDFLDLVRYLVELNPPGAEGNSEK